MVWAEDLQFNPVKIQIKKKLFLIFYNQIDRQLLLNQLI